jgi:hypothetical protein
MGLKNDEREKIKKSFIIYPQLELLDLNTSGNLAIKNILLKQEHL